MINKVNELRQIGSRMSVCRQNRNMTQEELSNRLGIMLMYGKEASNRKQEIDRQHHTIPNQRS